MTKRQGLIAQLAGSIEWRLRESRLEALPLVAFPGWHLRNPRHWGADEVAHSQAIALGSLDGDLMLSSRGLSLECDLAADVFPAEAFGVISEVLRRLRYVSRQFSLSCQVIALSQHGATLGGDAFHDVARDFSTTFVRNYRMPTAITEAHMEAVAAMGPDFRVPVHAEVFLDALDAHIQQDFRKALLYGAIAVEAYAREQLEAAAQANLERHDVRHRTISVPLGGGGSVLKDPVYDTLTEADSFPRLLHEAPLYVLGRSLLVDQPVTYRDTRRLYATRNKIAHLGAPPGDEKHFAATEQGSREALQAAVDTIAWFGDAGPYIVWDGKLVSAVDGRQLPM